MDCAGNKPVEESNDYCCTMCGLLLRDVYACCTVCADNVLLCQKCLAKGVEFADHCHTHTYVMMRLDFTLLEARWTASEELELLDALNYFGSNDWESVANYIGRNHSPKECKEHYLQCYHSVPRLRLNPAYIAHRVSSHNPPRFTSSSVLHNAFSGYGAARGEFKVDYDNDAECCLSEMDFNFAYEPLKEWDDEDKALSRKLLFAVLEGYRWRLEMRNFRHKVVRRHGLIQPQKNFLWLRRYDDFALQWGSRGGERLPTTTSGLSSQIIKTLMKFAQYLSAFELDSLLESLKREADLKSNLNHLYELRRNGIASLQVGMIYKKLLQRRDDYMRERRKYLSNPVLSWRNLLERRLSKYPHVVGLSRRPAPPLDISKLPGFEKLNGKERELCSVARIVPDSFFEFRNILVAECLKQGGLRLAQARSLIKIDVNKTRKLYDFLIEEGALYQP